MEENKIHKHNHNERVYNRGVDMLRSPERTEKLEIERVADLCLGEGIKSVLDIGTGSALFAEAFYRKGITVAGIDTNPGMVEAAGQFVPEGEFQLAPAEKIPFADESFDLTFFGVVFHEVDDYLKALSEAYRVSLKSTAILEWYYRIEDYGPPLEHRLKSEFIKEIAIKTGYKNFEEIKLNNLVLYKLTKNN